jgi:hypothetical protein
MNWYPFVKDAPTKRFAEVFELQNVDFHLKFSDESELDLAGAVARDSIEH